MKFLQVLLAPVLILSTWLKANEIKCEDFRLEGDVVFGDLGRLAGESVGEGFWLSSGRDVDGDGKLAGSLSRDYGDLTTTDGRWYRLRIRALAQEGFAVGGTIFI